MSKPQQPDTSDEEVTEMGYDPSLIKVHDTPPYSTEHVAYGRPHPDHSNQDYDPNSLDVLSDLDPSDFKRADNVAEGPQSDQNEDPVEP